MTHVVEMNNISKQFPGVLANDDVSIRVEQGTVCSLVGENGAGKSTLMNVLCGLYQPDGGEIVLRGKRVVFRSSADAIASGIGMVHQHFMLSPELTVLENIILGKEPLSGGRIDWKRACAEADRLCDEYGFPLPLMRRAGSLPVGIQQKIEIVKILYRGADLLILDEPTAVLTPQETREFFANMKALTSRGKTIVFISHKLKEVMEVAHNVVVMRKAKVVHETPVHETDTEKLAFHMVGSGVAGLLPREKTKGEALLQCRDIQTDFSGGGMALNDLNLTVSKGEILGIAGVSGNGQKELAELLAGLLVPSGGALFWNGKNITGSGRRAGRAMGISYISDDRKEEALCIDWGVDLNSVAGYQDSPPFSKGIFKRLQPSAIREKAQGFISRFSIKTPGPQTPAAKLSGGNQQKIVVARETMFGQKLIIASEPTRGVDIGAISAIHNHLVGLRNGGTGVVLISSDLDEIFTLSDRIAVIYEGRIVFCADSDKTDREEVGLHMAGLSESGATA